jgi:DNA-binding CsgD family transcriptional regulator/transcriptional regulator with XRE-family HTH domain/predicted Ser/Thr protein kinase
MRDLTGHTIGPYRLVDKLGEGGMARVYKAYHSRLERYVALKCIHPQLVATPGFLQRFEREAKILARLAHPNIVHLYDFDEADGQCYLAMEYGAGGTLKDRQGVLNTVGLRMAPNEVQSVLLQVSAGLDYAHQHGILHRDIKPSNILLTEEGRALLSDFGLARMVDTPSDLTNQGAMLGTPAYLSPEQGRGETAHIGPPSDVYALGVVLYELLTGRVPFTAETPLAVVLKQLNDPIPSARALNPALPEALEPVLRTALAKDPAARYQRAGELAQAFQGAVAVAAPSRPAPALGQAQRLAEEMHPSVPREAAPPLSAQANAPTMTATLAHGTSRRAMAAEQPVPFGALLRRYREAAGLSQEDLAQRAGLTAAAIGALERGERKRPYPHTLQLLARALDLDDAHRVAFIAAVPSRGTLRTVGAPVLTPIAASGVSRPDDTISRSTDDRDVIASPVAHPDLGRGTTIFVGRQHELMALRAKLADAVSGQGGIVMLVGEAGIGKTYLARAFADDAVAQGAAVLWGSCFEGDWQPPYGPWVEALSAYVRAGPAETVRQALGPTAAPLARLVPEICAALRDLPLPSPLSPDEERVRLYDAIIRFLLAVSREQTLLLILDDLHWADPDSLRLLCHLARVVGRARMLVVGAYRDPEVGLTEAHPLMNTLSVLCRQSDYVRIAIRGFSHEEVAAYLAQSAGQALPQALVKVIEQETSGNPFYAREVFRHLREEAKLLQRDGRWTTDRSIRELGIPEGVRQVVGRRVACLSEPASALLRLAAGFSAGFGFDVLQRLSELPETVLLSCIDEALQAGLICVCGQVPPRYEFAHAIVRHTLYDGQNPDRQTRLHRQIALALEQRHVGEDVEDVAELAAQYHASAALKGAGKGIVYALRAAEQARAAYAHERAAGFLRMARDLAAESPAAEQADILYKLAVAEAEAVDLEHAPQSVEAALEAMSAAGREPRARAEFLAVVARALKDDGADATVWEPLVVRGLALVGDTRDLLWARLALLQDHFEVVQSGPIGQRQWLGHDPKAVEVARAEGDEEDYARTLNPLDWRTREESEGVLTLARTWSRPVAVMWALDVAGRDLLYRHGAFREARAIYEELLAVSERFGSIPGQGEALTHITVSQIAIGDLLGAQETNRRAQEIIAHLGTSHRLQFVATNLEVVLAYFFDGDWPSLAEAVAGYATGAAAVYSQLGMIAAASAALSMSRAGSVTKAHALLQHLTSVAEHAAPTTYAQSIAVSLAATATWELEATEYADIYRRLTLDLLRAGVGDSPFGPLALWAARMCALLGDLSDAQDYFEQARRKLNAQGLTHMRAILDYDQARALICAGVTDRTGIITFLDAALEGFRAHGMLGWAARATAQKETLAALPRSGQPTGRQYPAGLTAREAEVLQLVAAGLTNKEVAVQLVVSVPTVERHVANIYGKIGARRRYEAMAFAQRHGLGPPDAALPPS